MSSILCEAAAMDAAIMLGRPNPRPVSPCDQPAAVEVHTATSGSYHLCADCKEALDLFTSLGRRVLDANPEAVAELERRELERREEDGAP